MGDVYDFIGNKHTEDETIEAQYNKCGEIFIHKSDELSTTFMFSCVFCNKAFFTNVSDFFEHFKEVHFKPILISSDFDELVSACDKNREFMSSESKSFLIDSNSNKATKEIQELHESYTRISSFHKQFTKMQNDSLEKMLRVIENKGFPCKVCEEKYLLKSSLQRHRKLAHPNEDSVVESSQSYFGDSCEEEFETTTLLSKHKGNNQCVSTGVTDGISCKEVGVSKKDVNDKDFTCDMYDSKFPYKSSLQKHKITLYKNKDANKLFACSICNEKFEPKDVPNIDNITNEETLALEISERIHECISQESGEVKAYFCKMCGEKCFLKSSIQRHFKYVHIGIKPDTAHSTSPFSNESENFDSKTSSLLNFPQRKQYLNPKQCRYCDRLFKRPCVRISHEYIHTGEKPYKCKYCEKAFRLPSNLKRHENFHEGKKPHKCTMCDAAFTDRSNLKQHIRRHLGDKKLPCQYCGKSFVLNSEREIHERTHTGEKPFQCSQCGKCFTTSESLFLHNLKHTNNRRYKCEQCNKKFFKKNDLDRHILVHTGERPFQCEICDATYRRKSNLRTHRKTHSDIFEYECNICGRAFKQKPNFKCHMKIHGIPISQTQNSLN